ASGGVDPRSRDVVRLRSAYARNAAHTSSCPPSGPATKPAASAAKNTPAMPEAGTCATTRQRWSRYARAVGDGQKRVAKLKASTGLLDLDYVGRALRHHRLNRSRPALSHYIARGWLTPSPNELGIYLFTDEAVASPIKRLRDGADGRSRRVSPDDAEKAQWRVGWTKKRHGAAAAAKESGRLASVLAAADGKQVGRKRELTSEQEARILKPDDNGASVRAIAQNVRVGRGKVERFLKKRDVTKPAVPDSLTTRTTEVAALLATRPWLTIKEIAAPKHDGGIGADGRAVRNILTRGSAMFERRTGPDATALGRRPTAVVWALRVNTPDAA
ncbi:MAG: hypothetical protein ABSG43_09645, partial [Solirubrobacteraceae bacterium]